jgi:hypothetical protein
MSTSPTTRLIITIAPCRNGSHSIMVSLQDDLSTRGRAQLPRVICTDSKCDCRLRRRRAGGRPRTVSRHDASRLFSGQRWPRRRTHENKFSSPMCLRLLNPAPRFPDHAAPAAHGFTTRQRAWLLSGE